MRRFPPVLALLAAVAATQPVRGLCSFSSPIVHGGDFQGSIPGSILSQAAAVGGNWWEAGFGEQTPGAGNDSGSVGVIGVPATDAIWIARDRRGTSGIAITYDWTNPGVDNCLSSGIAGSGQMVAYLLDSDGDYAVIGVQGKAAPVGHHDFDDVDTAIGPYGNDILMRPAELQPVLVIHWGTLTETTVEADIVSARDSVNCFDDGSGVCDGPTVQTSATQILVGPGGPPLRGCGAGGCVDVTLLRGQSYCWDQGAQVAGRVVASPSACSLAPLPCTIDSDCEMFGLGTCLTPPLIVYQMGPALPAGCTEVAGPSVSDVAQNARSEKVPGGFRFTWEAASLNTTHFNVLGTRRGGEVLNESPIFAESNDGSTHTYEITIPSQRVRFHRSFVIQTVRSDGSIRETPVE